MVKYLDTPPSEEDVRDALASLNISAIELVRTGEKRFKELGLSKTSDAETLITALVQNPILIERPVVFVGDKAAIGRPPEPVLALFD